MATQEHPQQLFSIGSVAQRWGISRDTVRKLIESSDLRSVTIASRRMIPLSEIERAELVGAGIARKRRADRVSQ
jgi:excisionase family DNA binding protein